MKFVLTERGIELQAQMEAGAKLVISRAVASSELSENPQELTVINPEKQVLQIDSVVTDGDRAVITVILSNMGIEESYIVHQIGLYALDEEGAEVLFLVGQDETGDEIKAGTEEENVIEYNIALKVSNAEKVVFIRNLDDYVRKRQFYEHIEDYQNPHHTTKAQVGLSEVPNVPTNKQTPTWRRAADRSLPESGETLDAILGKIERYLYDLKSLAFTGEVNFSNLSPDFQNQLLNYCPFVTMYTDIPFYERTEDKMYLMVTDTRGITYNYCQKYVFMAVNISEEDREALALYGEETGVRSTLEGSNRIEIMQMMDYVALETREMSDEEIREQDTFYLFETEEMRLWQD